MTHYHLVFVDDYLQVVVSLPQASLCGDFIPCRHPSQSPDTSNVSCRPSTLYIIVFCSFHVVFCSALCFGYSSCPSVDRGDVVELQAGFGRFLQLLPYPTRKPPKPSILQTRLSIWNAHKSKCSPLWADILSDFSANSSKVHLFQSQERL